MAVEQKAWENSINMFGKLSVLKIRGHCEFGTNRLRLVFLHTISKIVQTLHTVVLHIQVIVVFHCLATKF